MKKSSLIIILGAIILFLLLIIIGLIYEQNRDENPLGVAGERQVYQTNNNVDSRPCYSDLQCFNGGGNTPIDGTHYVNYRCVSSSCQASQPIQVECTTNAQCSSGQICSLESTYYGHCITPNQGEYCGDGICQTNENNNLCASDCY